MKTAIKCLIVLFLLVSLGAAPAPAQTLPTFQHVIIIFQENRTPDNLFGGNSTFTPGVDIQQSALGQQWCLGACFDPRHDHKAWEQIWAPPNGQNPMCNGGNSPCTSPFNPCPSTTTYCNNQPVNQTPSNPQETYVSTTWDSSVVAPYFDIATKYGFANYAFQTNEGPSQPDL
jgi:hypothetical protein